MQELPQYIVDGLVLASIYALVAIGLTVVFGALEVPNFAHGGFVMLSAYLSLGLINGWHLNFFIAGLVVLPIAGVAGVATERIVFRPLRQAGELTLMLVALALYDLILNVASNEWGGQQPASVRFPLQGSLHLAGVVISYQAMIILAMSICFITGIAALVKKSQFGRTVRAVAEDPSAAEMVGVNVNRVHRSVFLVATALAGVAGLLLASVEAVTPTVGTGPLLIAFAIIVIGGFGNIAGSIVGALVIGVVESVVQGYIDPVFTDGIVFLIMVAYLTWRPERSMVRA